MPKKQKEIKIFSLDYLANEELTEDDLYYLFDCDSLFYSLIKEMFVCIGEFSNIQVLIDKVINKKNWMNKRHFKSHKQQEDFMNKAQKCIKNIYQYTDEQSKFWVEMFMIKYGFSLKKN